MTQRIGNATKISEVHSAKFNWPNEDGEIWRHVTNYELYDEETLKYESLEVYKDKVRRIILRGNLVPSPDCLDSPILVEIPILCYSIDFGLSLTDVNRGFWLNDEDQVWYKLEQPHPEYKSTAGPSLNLFGEYLKFYDAIVYGCGNETGQKLAKQNRKTGKYTCEKDITAIYRISNQYFSLDTVKSHATFFYENSTSAFADCGMMRSLEVSEDIKTLLQVSYCIGNLLFYIRLCAEIFCSRKAATRDKLRVATYSSEWLGTADYLIV